MLAVDTNMVVRLPVGDDPRQTTFATEAFATQQIFVAKSVLLETEWVLRGPYGLEPETIRESLLGLVGLRNVTLEDPEEVIAALEFTRHGLEFADALPLASRPAAVHFATSDRALIRRTKRLGESAVTALPL